MKQETFDPAVHVTLGSLARQAVPSQQSQRLRDLMALFLVGLNGERLPVLYRSPGGQIDSWDRELHYRVYHGQGFMPPEVKNAPESPPGDESKLWQQMSDADAEDYPGNFVAQDLVVRVDEVRDFVDRAGGPDWLATVVGVTSSSMKAGRPSMKDGVFQAIEALIESGEPLARTDYGIDGIAKQILGVMREQHLISSLNGLSELTVLKHARNHEELQRIRSKKLRRVVS